MYMYVYTYIYIYICREIYVCIYVYVYVAHEAESGIAETVCWLTKHKHKTQQTTKTTKTNGVLAKTASRKAGNLIERAQCRSGKTAKRQTGKQPKRTGKLSI